METIRNIQTVPNGEVHLQLPQPFWGQKVENIVLIAPLSTVSARTHKRSLRGSLKPYASESMDRIEKESFNLNISRYVSTANVEEKVDLHAVHSELFSLEQKIGAATKRHNEFLKELDLPLLP